jgi:hypothetical protein
MRARHAAPALLAALVLAGSPPAQAGHHSWDFTEIFSNADGSVQFIEMFCASNGEAGLGPFTIQAGANTFTFVTNLPSSSTANTWVLIATADFASTPGAPAPDYVLPDAFFSTAGGTLNYAGGADVWSYGAVPTDGVSSLDRSGSTTTNSPTNFAGDSGSIDLNPVVPGLTATGVVLLIGAVLLATSGILRRRSAAPTTAS